MGVKLIDRGKPLRELNMKRCKMAAEVAVRLGSFYNQERDELHQYFDRYWDGDSPPSLHCLKMHVDVSNIKWYIQNRLEFSDPIWTPDFLFGITRCGKIKWDKRKFPNFKWSINTFLVDLLDESPFGGDLGSNKQIVLSKNPYRWKAVPALYLASSEDSNSFVAGILASGHKYEFRGETYARYDQRVVPFLNSLGIPIEYSSESGLLSLVSPIWPALFSPLMPEKCRSYWCDIEKPFRGNEYAAILWTVYVDSSYIKDGIPFLQSRRTVYYKYKSEAGAVDVLKRLRVRCNLVQLDDRFRNIAHNWSQKMYNDNEDES